MTQRPPRFLIGVSHKMYFTHASTREWCASVGEIARAHVAITGTPAAVGAELFVIPSFLSICSALELLGDVASVGAQDIAIEDFGAFTGEVSGAELVEVGCRVVLVGHAERRQLFGETEEIVAAKTSAALRNGLAPVVCIGEAEKGDPADAAAECVRQLESAIAPARARGQAGRMIAAYEPYWAIGAAEPASDDHIRTVCATLREHLASWGDFPESAVIYGGSAGPGLLTRIADSVDGVFLGRFAHDPHSISDILDEISGLLNQTPAPASIRAPEV